ncbi:11873_t:CDS:2, partial [Racocetra fulgida]
MIQELLQDKIEKEEMLQVEPIEEVIITQEKAAKKQKVNMSLNVEASPDLSHLFLAANIIKQLQLLQSSQSLSA